MQRGGNGGVWCGALLLCAGQIFGAAIAQWEFNGNLDSAAGGAALIEEACAPAAAPLTEFLTMDIGGANAQVAHFSRGTVYRMTHDLGTSGGGQYLSNYTLIMDVMFPADRAGFTALWQTNESNSNDGDWFIRDDNGIGISGQYAGNVTDAEWHRLALVIDCTTATFTSFIDGVQVPPISPGVNVDGRWSLGATALLFADEDQENWEGYINSVQLRPYVMTADELAELGPAEAKGIPAPAASECEPASAAEDCNQNGIKDSCDITKFGTSRDCNLNGTPDECEIDAQPTIDCDKNGVIDACEVDRFDCNKNGILDSCDIVSGTEKDCNANGIPDSCEMGLVQWDFNGDLAEAGGGEELLPYVTMPAVEPVFEFEQADIGDDEAQVVRFGRGTAFQFSHDLGGNGGGERLNRYTLLMDVAFSADRSASGGWAVLFQTEIANADDGEWFIREDGGIGISGVYGGMAGDGNWHRLALVVDLAKGTYTSYVDGVFAQTIQSAQIDGRFSVSASAFLFADENEENAEGLVNSVQLRRYPMSEAEIAALGGPTAVGLPTNDCNKNSVPDACDIASGTSADANSNGLPDECERPLETTFKRGYTNTDSTINIADAVFILSYLFAKGQAPSCLKTADTNDDTQVNIADAVYLLGYLFAQKPAPKAPFLTCGTDPTPDQVTCVSFAPCQ